MSASKVPRQTAVVCAAAGLVAFLVLLVDGQPRAGGALGIGLVLGGANALMAGRAAELGGAFRLLALARLGLLSALALIVSLLLEPAAAWLTLIGIGSSQFLMSAIAAREVIRR